MTVIKYIVYPITIVPLELFATTIIYDSLSCERSTVVKLFISKSGTIIRVQGFKLQCIRSYNDNSVTYTSLPLRGKIILI